MSFLVLPTAANDKNDKTGKKKKKLTSVPRFMVRKSNGKSNRIHPSNPFLYFFLASWIALPGTICIDRVAYTGQAPTHPLKVVANISDQTHRYIQCLDTLEDLSPGSFHQNEKLQANKWWSEMLPKSKEEDTESHCDDHYVDAYQDFLVEIGDRFFDAEQEIAFD
jgi:hypothetical protein